MQHGFEYRVNTPLSKPVLLLCSIFRGRILKRQGMGVLSQSPL
ncbi:MAG: hypothetical protein RJA69_2087 [Pseudomonadota bacterium]|jgi:hypothetical protein